MRHKLLYLLLAILVMALPASAYDFMVGGLCYNKNADSTSVTVTYETTSPPRYSSLSDSVEIPETVTDNGMTYSVTAIGESAFYYCSGMTSVVIPNSVTAIGDNAFNGCRGLTSIAIPNSVTTIGNETFGFCTNLADVEFSDSITTIGDRAFYFCSGLTSLVIPNSATTIGNMAFNGCSGLTSIMVAQGNPTYDSRDNCNAIVESATNTLIAGCKNTIIPSSVTSIGSNAFRSCSSLTSIAIPSSVTSIGTSAFNDCSGLTSVAIPNSVTSIGAWVFNSCGGLTSIYSSIENPNNIKLGNYVFRDVNKLTCVLYVPAGLVDLYREADQWKDFVHIEVEETPTENLTYEINDNNATASVVGYTGELPERVVIPSATVIDGATYPVTRIGDSAFRGCSGLSSVTIGNFVTTIDDLAFYHSGLTSVIIGNSVSTIGKSAFNLCTNLKEVELPNSVTSIGDGAFGYCSGLTSVTIGNSVATIGKNAFKECSGLTSIVVPNSVTSIGNMAFSYCHGLTSVTIGSSVATMGSLAFGLCEGLTSILVVQDNPNYDSRSDCNAIIETGTNTLILGCKNTNIPGSVTAIGKSAFYGCSGLTGLTIPNSVTTIGNSAFYGCTGLTSVTIPNSVTTIGDEVFWQCSGLMSVIIPSSVTSIGKHAFRYCRGLTDIYSSIENPNDVALGDNVFRDVNKSTCVLYVPAGSVDLYREADQWKDFVHIEVEETPTENLTYKINDDSATASVVGYTGELPERVVIPSATVIDGTTYLVTRISPYAFYGCDNMKSVVIGNSVTTIEYESFEDCTNLDTLTLGKSLTTIGNFAFSGCTSLKSVSIPKSLTTVGGYAFFDCGALERVEISDVAAWCGIAFANSVANPLCYAHNLYLNGEKVTDLVIPDNVTEIKSLAFYSCSGLTSVTIPNSVTAIGSHAFRDCSGMMSVAIGNSVTTIGNYAFYLCSSSLETITVASGNSKYDSRDSCNALIETETNTLILGCKNTNIPGTATALGDYAFYNCTGLTGVTIPASITSIGKSVFSGCSGLEAIVVESDNLKYDSRDSCNALIETETNTLILGCKNTNIPETVTAIGDQAFYGCTGLTDLFIPDSVTAIGQAAFNVCENLKTVNIPSSVTVIEPYTFGDCFALESITIPASVTSIGTYSFSDCKKLKSMDLPNSVTTIELGAFWGCTDMETMTLGNSVTEIGDWAFTGCVNLLKLISKSDPTKITLGNDVFDTTTVATCELRVPEQYFDAYSEADQWKDFLHIVAIVDGDVNGDDVTSGADVTTLYNVLLDGTVADGDADVNGDGVVNGADVTALYNILLGQ